MTIWELLLLALGLAMDAFAVSLCQGLYMRRLHWKYAAIIALFFGGFQALMPVIGWFLGTQFAQYITQFDHWIAFVLLAFIGGKMIFDSLHETEKEDSEHVFRLKELLVLAIATSIDALAVGITFAFFQTNVAAAAGIIGGVTFVLCLFGVVIGHRFGAKFQNKAEIIGGIVLILIGLKILLEHLNVIGW